MNVYILMVFVSVFLLWVGFDTYIIKTTTTKSKDMKKESMRNNQVLKIGTTVVMVTMFTLLAVNVFIRPLFLVNIPLLSIFGSSLALFGILFRYQAFVTLKNNFDSLIQVKPDQKLIKDGLYKYFRHPSYTGNILTFLGLGIGSLNIISMILLPVFLFVVYQKRIEIEEIVLIEGFGKEYMDYRKETWGLLPVDLKPFKKRVS